MDIHKKEYQEHSCLCTSSILSALEHLFPPALLKPDILSPQHGLSCWAAVLEVSSGGHSDAYWWLKWEGMLGLIGRIRTRHLNRLAVCPGLMSEGMGIEKSCTWRTSIGVLIIGIFKSMYFSRERMSIGWRTGTAIVLVARCDDTGIYTSTP